eukprot:TRINITY_DN24242_c0_g1_i1.p1 TRINITY_DN24242_c0_g1~~TRINITY_DN24242_c0_g1_i1.p1  ORF type:complete len:178 (+),score=41.91 TRINITY_DN24242_c0_g1_i1:87-620(+)
MAMGRHAVRRSPLGLVCLALGLVAFLGNRDMSFVGNTQVPRALPRISLRALCAQVKAPPADGEREIVDGPNGPIVVANVGGKYYAVDAKCPHLGLPMKQGKIEDGPDGPRLSCNFHNSQFDMKTGVCTRWVTGALGMDNDFIGGLMSNVGGQKANVQSYDVVEADDGTLSIVKPEKK